MTESTVAARTGGPSLIQERRLVTEIPGPQSRARLERKKEHVADGVGTMLPVFVTAAGGGVLVDVDGNSLIDFGSGHRGHDGRQRRAGGGRRRVREQVEAFTHTCFMITPYEGYVDVCDALDRADPGRPREEVGALQLRRRGGRERGQDRPARHRPRRGRRSSTTATTAAPT